MSFLDFNGLSRFHDKVKIMLSKKQDKLTQGDNIKLDNNGNIGIAYDVPVGGGTIKLTVVNGTAPLTGKIGISKIYDKIEASGSLNSCFSNDTDLEVFDIAGSDLTTVNNSGYMFYNCANLKEIDFTGSPIQKAAGMGYMFYDCKNLSNSSIHTFLFKPLVSCGAQYMFYGCEGLEEIPAEWSFQNATNATAMFRGCKNLTTFSPESLNSTTLKQCYYMFMDCGLTSMPDITIPKATTCASMFRNDSELQSVGTITTGTTLTAVPSMFLGCKKLPNINLFNTSKVTNFEDFLHNCYALETIPGFDTSSATNVISMFYGCRAITFVPTFNFTKVTQSKQLYEDCISLTTVPDQNLPLSTEVARMFYGCSSLVTAPKVYCPKAVGMRYMFYNCPLLETVPYVDCSASTDNTAMFLECPSLKNIHLVDLGKGYLTSAAAGKSEYKLDLRATAISYEDFIALIQNDLYDIKSKGCNTQCVVCPLSMWASITEADKSMALAKGWEIVRPA